MLDVEIKNNLNWIRLLFPIQMTKEKLLNQIELNNNMALDTNNADLITINYYTDDYCYLIGYTTDGNICNRINSIDVYELDNMNTPITTVEFI